MSLISDTFSTDTEINKNRIICDTNNNTSNNFKGKRGLSKTYGLRPRSTLRRLLIDSDICELKPTIVSKNKGDKQAPLSKYRRKTANARERHRMKEINDAFSTLRQVLPPIHTRRTVMSSMTKITTLRLAVAYIRALSEILDENGSTPSETTKTLLTAANLRIWNENNVQNNIPSVPVSSEPNQIFPKSEVLMDNNNTIDAFIIDNCQINNIEEKKPSREQGFLAEKSTANNITVNECDLDDNSSFWDDIPLLNDFQWTIT